MIRWLPMTPLTEHVGRLAIETDNQRHITLSVASTLLNRLGLDRQTTDGGRWQRRFDRAVETGRIRLEFAEDFCDLIGKHPTEIWGTIAYYAACERPDPDELAADRRRCAQPPEPERHDRFCDRPAAWRAIGHDQHYGLFDHLKEHS